MKQLDIESTLAQIHKFTEFPESTTVPPEKFQKKMKEKKSVVNSYWKTFLLNKGNKQCL